MKIFGRKSMRCALAAFGLLAVSLALTTPKVFSVIVCACACDPLSLWIAHSMLLINLLIRVEREPFFGRKFEKSRASHPLHCYCCAPPSTSRAHAGLYERVEAVDRSGLWMQHELAFFVN